MYCVKSICEIMPQTEWLSYSCFTAVMLHAGLFSDGCVFIFQELYHRCDFDFNVENYRHAILQ